MWLSGTASSQCMRPGGRSILVPTATAHHREHGDHGEGREDSEDRKGYLRVASRREKALRPPQLLPPLQAGEGWGGGAALRLFSNGNNNAASPPRDAGPTRHLRTPA